jgi:hypothetical protein
MSSKTHIQAQALFDDLKGAKGPVAWQVGKISNALLEMAKQEQPDNVVLAVIEPFQPGPNDKHIADALADDVRAIVGQIARATYKGRRSARQSSCPD